MADEDELPEDELGEPIRELREIEHAPSAGFVDRLSSSLRRRGLGSQLATLTWSAFGGVFLEFLSMIFSAFQPRSPTEESRTDASPDS